MCRTLGRQPSSPFAPTRRIAAWASTIAAVSIASVAQGHAGDGEGPMGEERSVEAPIQARVHRGAMRHVQLVALPDSDESQGLVASASHLFKRTKGGKLERDGSAITLHRAGSGKLLETMAVEGALLPSETFSAPVIWRFLNAEPSPFVAMIRGGSLQLRQFPTGTVQCRVEGARKILDGRVYMDAEGESRIEVLVLGEGVIRRVECDRFGKLVQARVVSRTGVAGAFVRGFDRTILGTARDGVAIVERPWGEDALGAGLRVFNRLGEVQRVIDLPGTVAFAKEPRRIDFRCAAWGSDEGFLVAFSQPAFDRAVGRLTLVDISLAGEESVLYDGTPWPRIVSNTVNASHFGQCIGFVRDVDGDGLADVAIGAPSHMMGLPALSIIGSGGGEVLSRFEGEFFDRVGASVSIGPMGRRALVGVVPPGYPDDLSRPGYACLIEVPEAAERSFDRVRTYRSTWR